ncbi:hypothetical protein [Nonomuraea sp. NPDC049695]|uniref:hypothetical protein n=1 Tax=Nonomuraea sp. NPDC049695 TaxID=3154734 RepID=UPI003421EAC8
MSDHRDLWPFCWCDDRACPAYGDCSVFSNIGTARVRGMPGNLAGRQRPVERRLRSA